MFQKNGERFGAARGYLHPVMSRPNLTVMTGVTVNKVLFDGKRATGVEILQKRKKVTLEGAEIILSGGAINSPKLLKLSGVGPKDELEKHGIPLVHELPGVGENLQDHPDILVVQKSKRSDTIAITPGVLFLKGPVALYNYIFKTILFLFLPIWDQSWAGPLSRSDSVRQRTLEPDRIPSGSRSQE